MSAETPASGAGSKEEPIVVTYWPPLRAVLQEDPGGIKRLQMRCDICLRTLDENLYADSPDSNDHPVICKGADLLPCGHIIGRVCYRQWLQHRRDPTYGCPQRCQTHMHPCGHIIHPLPLLPGRLFTKLPRAVPEKGYVAKKCIVCNIDEVALMAASKVIGKLPVDMVELLGPTCFIQFSEQQTTQVWKFKITRHGRGRRIWYNVERQEVGDEQAVAMLGCPIMKDADQSVFDLAYPTEGIRYWGSPFEAGLKGRVLFQFLFGLGQKLPDEQFDRLWELLDITRYDPRFTR